MAIKAEGLGESFVAWLKMIFVLWFLCRSCRYRMGHADTVPWDWRAVLTLRVGGRPSHVGVCCILSLLLYCIVCTFCFLLHHPCFFWQAFLFPASTRGPPPIPWRGGVLSRVCCSCAFQHRYHGKKEASFCILPCGGMGPATTAFVFVFVVIHESYFAFFSRVLRATDVCVIKAANRAPLGWLYTIMYVLTTINSCTMSR